MISAMLTQIDPVAVGSGVVAFVVGYFTKKVMPAVVARVKSAVSVTKAELATDIAMMKKEVDAIHKSHTELKAKVNAAITDIDPKKDGAPKTDGKA